MESSGRICTYSHIGNQSFCIYWTSTSTGYSSTCMLLNISKMDFYCLIIKCDTDNLTFIISLFLRFCRCWMIQILVFVKQLYCALRLVELPFVHYFEKSLTTFWTYVWKELDNLYLKSNMICCLFLLVLVILKNLTHAFNFHFHLNRQVIYSLIGELTTEASLVLLSSRKTCWSPSNKPFTCL